MLTEPNKKRIYFFLYFFFALVLIYAIQDFQTGRNTVAVTGARGGVYAALFSVLAVLGSYYILTVWNIPLSSLSIVLWLITFYVLIVDLLQVVNLWSAAVHLGLSVLWILVVHFFTNYLRCYPEALSQVLVCVGIMFLFYIFSFFYASYYIHSYLLQFGKDRLAVLNLSYGVIVFLPWIALIRTKVWRRLGFLVVLLVVLISMKRGAIVVLPLMMVAAMFVETAAEKKSPGPFIGKVLLLLLFFIAGLAIADQWSGGFLSKRFSSEELASGSGRSHAYRFALQEYWQRHSPLDLLFGYGSGGSLRFFGTGVHNEWLEFLFSFGLLGVVLYGLLFLVLIWKVFRLTVNSSFYAPAYAMAVTYMLIVGLYGGIYFVHSTLYIMMFFGAVEGLVGSEDRQYNDEVGHKPGISYQE